MAEPASRREAVVVAAESRDAANTSSFVGFSLKTSRSLVEPAARVSPLIKEGRVTTEVY